MTDRFRNGALILCATWAAATLAMLLHNLDANPQLDTQLIPFSLEHLQALASGHPLDSLLAVRKYPLLPSLLLALLYGVEGIVLLLLRAIATPGQMADILLLHPALLYLPPRLFIVSATVLTFWLLARVSRAMLPDTSPSAAVILLLSSLLTLTFATSVRPHALAGAGVMGALLASLPLLTRKGWREGIVAFGTAALAFCLLQSAALAILFPVWALLWKDGRLRFSRPLLVRLLVLCLFFGAVASLLGYPFAWREMLLGRFIGVGFGNTDMNGQPWNGLGFQSLAMLLIGSEIVIALFALIGLSRMVRTKEPRHPMMGALLLFLAVFVLLFGLNGGTPSRFFLPILPLFALLGVRALSVVPRGVIGVVVLYTLLVHLRFLTLALQSDTWQQARTFILAETDGPIVTLVPKTFLGIPPTRVSLRPPLTAQERVIAAMPADLPDARAFLARDLIRDAAVVVSWRRFDPALPAADWQRCRSFGSEGVSDSGFLWAEEEWGLLSLWRVSAFGPALDLYCRRFPAS